MEMIVNLLKWNRRVCQSNLSTILFFIFHIDYSTFRFQFKSSTYVMSGCFSNLLKLWNFRVWVCRSNSTMAIRVTEWVPVISVIFVRLNSESWHRLCKQFRCVCLNFVWSLATNALSSICQSYFLVCLWTSPSDYTFSNRFFFFSLMW